MRVIYKYPLQITYTGDQEVEMPKFSDLLCVQMQNEVLCLWAEVDTKHENEARKIRIFGTGHEIPAYFGGHHLGTIQQNGGALIWHVFEVLKK